MAVRTTLQDYTTQWAQTLPGATGFNPQRQPDDGGFVHYIAVDFTMGATLGDAGSTFGIAKIYAGRHFILSARLSNSAFGTSRTLDIGWGAHVKHDGTAVVADPDGLMAAKDVAAISNFWDFNVVTSRIVLDVRQSVDIYGTVNGGTLPVGATLKGHILVGRLI